MPDRTYWWQMRRISVCPGALTAGISIRLIYLFYETGITHGTLIQVTLVRSLRSNALRAFSIARMIRYVNPLCEALKTS